MMTTCKYCGTKVIPMSNGCCPNCQEPLTENAVKVPLAIPSHKPPLSDRISELVLWCIVGPISLLFAGTSLFVILDVTLKRYGPCTAPLEGVYGLLGLVLGSICFPLSAFLLIGAVVGIVSWFRKR